LKSYYSELKWYKTTCVPVSATRAAVTGGARADIRMKKTLIAGHPSAGRRAAETLNQSLKKNTKNMARVNEKIVYSSHIQFEKLTQSDMKL